MDRAKANNLLWERETVKGKVDKMNKKKWVEVEGVSMGSRIEAGGLCAGYQT